MEPVIGERINTWEFLSDPHFALTIPVSILVKSLVDWRVLFDDLAAVVSRLTGTVIEASDDDLISLLFPSHITLSCCSQGRNSKVNVPLSLIFPATHEASPNLGSSKKFKMKYKQTLIKYQITNIWYVSLSDCVTDLYFLCMYTYNDNKKITLLLHNVNLLFN